VDQGAGDTTELGEQRCCLQCGFIVCEQDG
jgi:hypothetical protein